MNTEQVVKVTMILAARRNTVTNWSTNRNDDPSKKVSKISLFSIDLRDFADDEMLDF